jgi:NADPH-dependent 2,4-dienoyl-CoA reductase/sulfur reductase-like enzyme
MTASLLTAPDPAADDLLALLRDGLPQVEGTGRRIVVVGAGIAGLVAGWLLRRAGHRVTLLEARPRMGGASSPIAGRSAVCSPNTAPCVSRASTGWRKT